ncbi:oligosaccharide flippase family protein [Gracilibacillus sp. S3-1-1]|uniref:Oligosaccharide flippase family protein n=1 Tax=Gracilibacillus pellucidus TaxID=3095368 RepID=A0ACC6M863_9BACI|nr:oligosaccharide flippase family protein [Gracilibacillus sp. S3-1-1]MDX8047129.1 oligosaccharide flippase family protein [Gracilibacillus sp. S3-1-1]
MISKSLMKKSGLYFIGNLSSKIMSVLLIPIYAFYITPNDLGYFDFSQTLMGVLSPIILLAIWEAILKFVLSEDNEQVKRKIITTAILFSLFTSLIITLGTIIFDVLFEFSIQYLYLILFMIVLHSLVFVWQYYSRAYGENKLFVLSGILSTIVNFIFVIVLVVLLDLGLFGLLVSYNIGQLTIIIIIEKKLKIIKNIKFLDFEGTILKKMLYFSSPLVLNLTSAWLISGFGRFIVTLNLGVDENGVYSFANRFALIITTLGTVVTMAIIEEAILAVKKKGLDDNFGKTIDSLFKIFQSMIILLIPLIVVFYDIFLSDSEYYNSLLYIPGLLIFAVFNSMASNIGSVFQALDKTKYLFITTLLGAVVTVAVSVIFINTYGILAVIVAQILGALTMMFSRYILANNFSSLKVRWSPVIIQSTLFLFISFICLNSNIIITIILEIIIIALIIFFNRKLVTKVLNKLKK